VCECSSDNAKDEWACDTTALPSLGILWQDHGTGGEQSQEAQGQETDINSQSPGQCGVLVT